MLTTLLTLGSLLLVAGGGWLFALAFAESILWGLGSMLLWPAVPIAFAITTWPRAWIPVFMHFTGVLMLFTGAIIWISAHPQVLF